MTRRRSKVNKSEDVGLSRSSHRAHRLAKAVRKTYDSVWNNAYKYKLYSTEIQGSVQGSRRRRLIPKKAIQAACSAAAAKLYDDTAAEAGQLGVDSIKPESRAHPWLPSFTKGAVVMLESFLCAYAQEAVADAWAISEHAIGSKRLSEDTLKFGFYNVNRRIFLSKGDFNLLGSCVPQLKDNVAKPSLETKESPICSD